MTVTYDVRIWKTSVYEGQRRKTYKVRWVVAGKSHNRSFKTSALAESSGRPSYRLPEKVRRSTLSLVILCRCIERVKTCLGTN
jgi:hypothetical protein